MGVPTELVETSIKAITTAHSAPTTDGRCSLGRFLTAEDDWIAHHQGATMLLLWAGVLVVPGVIEWMI